jgi:protoheme IX farnesyltransferase
VVAAGGEPDWNVLTQTSIATALLFAGASTLNQLLERDSDALMSRTADRPLPAGLLQPWEALVLGCVLAGSGLAYLLAANQSLAAALGAFALILYVLIYTPLKRRTPLNTLIGAIPGALPPLMGWASVRGRLDGAAVVLFLVLFLWQIPHFLAIAWMYRDEYARAGLRMFPLFDPSGVRTGRQMIGYSLALIPASVTPVGTHGGGWLPAVGVLMVGVMFCAATVGFARNPTNDQARFVFRMSVLYLAILLLVYVLAAIVDFGT